jgi:hypothetical protein
LANQLFVAFVEAGINLFPQKGRDSLKQQAKKVPLCLNQLEEKMFEVRRVSLGGFFPWTQWILRGICKYTEILLL